MQCPLCDHVWPDGRHVCTCGYDLDRHDARAAIQRLRTEILHANGMWIAGSAAVFLAPAVFFVGVGMLALLALVLFGGGITLVTLGLVRGDAAKKRLVRATERTQLPPARLI